MGFESPWMLLGAVGGLVPIVIHLRLRRQAPVVALDAVMRLVLEGGTTAMRLRLVHALLLACRVALIVAAAILFARPYRNVRVDAAVAGEHPVALAVVLDTSLSMRLGPAGGTAWDRGRARVLRLLNELPAESEVFVVLADKPGGAMPASGSGWDAGRAVRFVEALQASRGGTDLSAGVRRAVSLVRASPLREKRIAVVSDFTDHGTAGFPSAEELAGIGGVPVDVGAPGPVSNRAVAEVTAAPAPDLSPSHVRVRVDVLNDAEQAFEDVVTVRIGAAGTARKVGCAPGGRCAWEFVLEAEPGATVGEVRLPPDDLPDDDVRRFVLAPRNRDAVLVVNGEPSRRPELDEVFFLGRALGLRVGDEPGFSVTGVRPDELSPLHLQAVGTAVLANTGRLRAEQVGALAAFVAAGGGLLVTLGDNAPMDDPSLAPLLPAPYRDDVDLGGARGRDLPGVTWADPDHPVVAGLVGGPGTLSTAQVRRYRVLDDGWAPGSAIVARLSTGAPLLVERRLGRGTVLAWLSTIDRDWNDLPLRPAYAPFLRSAFRYLQGFGGNTARSALLVGEPRRVEMPQGLDRVVVTPPAGDPVSFTVADDFAGTGVPGVYRVDGYQAGRAEAVRTETFVVNVDPAESVVKRTQGVPPSLARAPEPQLAAPGAAATARSSLGNWVLGLALLLLLGEAWLRGKA